MLIGPVFTRELTIAPRRSRTYASRAAYVAVLGFVVVTSYLVLTGTQLVGDVGDLARFGTILFQLMAPLQLALAVFFAAMLSASAVAQEKDRRTLILLLLTNLTNSELVLGKLMASLLNVLMMLVAALPVFMITALLGGISFGQIGRVFAVTLASVLVCGSLGSMLALWREKTFQALALTVLALVLWLAAGEIVAAGALGESMGGISCQSWAAGFSPWQAILAAVRPFVRPDLALGIVGTPVNLFLLVSVVLTVLLNGVAVAFVRVWNPSREVQLVREVEEDSGPRESIWGVEHDLAEQSEAEQTNDGQTNAEKTEKSQPAAAVSAVSAVSQRTRHVWDNPVVWREIRTWAYGRKILVIRLVYLLLFALAAGSLHWMIAGDQLAQYGGGAVALVPLFLLSLVLVNAQSVTSITSERDGRALDILLVTDLSPKEIVFGKLGGVFYNTKEMVLGPVLLCVYLWYAGALSLENLIYVLGGLTVLYLFVAMLGVHAGINYDNSRTAIATSLGTVFFLFLGVAVCMRMIVAFSGSFQAQLQPFLAFMVGGGIGLYVALGARNPSSAIAVAAFICPIATFYAIASFLLESTLGVFLVTAAAYGFTTVAMMIPAIYEFDVATGRASAGED